MVDEKSGSVNESAGTKRPVEVIVVAIIMFLYVIRHLSALYAISYLYDVMINSIFLLFAGVGLFAGIGLLKRIRAAYITSLTLALILLIRTGLNLGMVVLTWLMYESFPWDWFAYEGLSRIVDLVSSIFVILSLRTSRTREFFKAKKKD